MLVAGPLGSEVSVIYTADPMARKKARPTIKERLTKDTIKGIQLANERCRQNW